MRRFMMTLGGGTLLVLGSALVGSAQDKAPAQAPAKPAQAPVQTPAQAPAKQAPAQAPTQKVTPVQKPVQAPTQKHSVAQCQSPVQKGEPMKTARVGRFNRYYQ